MNRLNILFLIVIGILVSTCNRKGDPTPSDTGFSYYPINEGDYLIYDVIDTAFIGVQTYEINNYQVKEEIHESIVVNDEVRYQIYLYYKSPGGEWNDYPDSNWTVFSDKRRIVKVEDNVRFVKLVFPFEAGKKWDGNISDPENDPQEHYTMTEVRRPFTYTSLYAPIQEYTYPETVSVVQFDNSSAIDLNYAIEVYANNIGLVYKEIKVYKYEQSNLALQQVELGQHIVKTLIEHGKYK